MRMIPMTTTRKCPRCKVEVKLPDPAVRLTGKLSCPNGHVFMYPWRQHYNADGSLKRKEVTR